MDRVYVVSVRKAVSEGTDLYDHDYRQFYVAATSFGEAEKRVLDKVPTGYEISDIAKNNSGDVIVV